MKSKILLALIVLSSSLFAQGIVIKKGNKEQKVAPLKQNLIQKMSQKNSVRAGWEIDGQKNSKMNMLKQNSEANRDLACH